MGKGIRGKYGVKARFCDLELLLMDIYDDHSMELGKGFCFILGAGASIESGILSGQKLVERWDKYIEARHTADEYQNWLDELNIKSQQEKYAHYSDYYIKRFEDDHKSGPIFIRNMTAKAEPSVGYLALATILTETKNNVIVTTNFDK